NNVQLCNRHYCLPPPAWRFSCRVSRLAGTDRLPVFSWLAGVLADGLATGKAIHVSWSVVLPLLARGDRVWLSACRDIVGLLLVLSLDRQYRYSAWLNGHPLKLPRVSLPLHFAVFPAKCAHPSCLIFKGAVHS